ncbi:hypothetical protein [Kitasatospora viridis]|uniref:Lipoprotein LprG n=1 Tax=Kitasatospora viridis TaxID=281105 RepID=A0A561SEI4_9ACTN|nr:hypothetical protein [Kitasatospora viridis]TWF73271.1 hypothetical protein FHX73_16422 [Kitasatospora viridis]
MSPAVFSAVRSRPLATTATALTGLLAAGLLLALPGHGAPASRPVTTDEAARLALSRLTSYEASPVLVDITVPSDGTRTLVHGLVDFRAHHAVGSYTTDGVGGPGLLAWDGNGVGVAPGKQPADPGPAALALTADQMPPQAWSPRAYTTDRLDTALRLTMAVAADRPDNAELLAQSGARWLRDEQLDGHRYGVFSGPLPRDAAAGQSHLVYWVDQDGNLRRLELRGADSGPPTTIDLTERHVDARVPAAPWGG